MSVTPIRDRKAERRSETQAEILAAAWEIAREAGLSELSLRELGVRVGMRAQSLYSYFDSKHAIYDAMFREANNDLLARIRALDVPNGSPEKWFRRRARVFVDFATEDPARAQLLFARPLPGFEPSPEAYAPATEVLELTRQALAMLGITEARLLDLWTATTSGLVHQQLANDPGGDRWVRLLDETIDMYLRHARPELGTVEKTNPTRRFRSDGNDH